MKMTSIVVVAAFCLWGCSEAPEPVKAIPIEPNVRTVEPLQDPPQEQMMIQAPIQKRITDKLAVWCEDEMNYLQKELRSGEAQESSKYRRYLLHRIKGIKEKCAKRK